MAHHLFAARPPRRGGSGSGRRRYQYDTPITWLRKAIPERGPPEALVLWCELGNPMVLRPTAVTTWWVMLFQVTRPRA